jgi:RHS repeat-associated protein
MARTETRQWSGATPGPDGEDQILLQMSTETTQVFYFAGRPVAQLTTGPELLYLTTDHLGTPVLATDSLGTAVWAGGVEPFGETWTAGSDNPDPESLTIGHTAAPALGGLSSEKVFLRYPGQWASKAFRVTGAQQEIYYNVHRWYVPGEGRFTAQDLLTRKLLLHPYLYALGNSLFYTDLLGLEPVHNGSGTPVPYKPEVGPPGQIWLCLPGETCNADGVYPPACNDFPIKIVNGCDADVDPSGKLIINCPYIDWSSRSFRESLSALGQLLTGGRTNARFHKVHKDWLTPNSRLYCGCDPAQPFHSPPPDITLLPLQ